MLDNGWQEVAMVAILMSPIWIPMAGLAGVGMIAAWREGASQKRKKRKKR